MHARVRSAHRLLGALLIAPFLLWTATGLLFLLKPGWSGAYELLAPFRDEALDPSALVPLARALPASTLVQRAEVGVTALGPVYRIAVGEAHTPLLVDARSGTRLSPLTEEAARRVAEDAASRSTSAERYGAVVSTVAREDAVEVAFSGGATVAVGRNDLSLVQHGPDTRRIDLLYRIHYLQWTGEPALDRPLALVAIAGTWVLAGLGVVLLRRPRRFPASDAARLAVERDPARGARW